MKMYNGNKSNILNVAHWNGGGSFLAKSERGKEKLEHISHYLNTYKIDMGISESNIDSDLYECEYQINNYSVMKSQGNISRFALYFKNDLVVKENSSCACTIESLKFSIYLDLNLTQSNF